MLNFRVTPEERADIEGWAKSEGLKVSDHIRAALQRDARRMPEPSEIPHEPPHETRLKAEVAKAVATGEPYSVEVKAGTSLPKDKAADLDRLTSQLSRRMPTRKARLEAERQLGLR